MKAGFCEAFSRAERGVLLCKTWRYSYTKHHGGVVREVLCKLSFKKAKEKQLGESERKTNWRKRRWK
jgi:hypothetical protein